MYRAVALATNDVIRATDLDVAEQESSESAMTVVSEVTVTELGGFQTMKTQVIDEFERSYLWKILSAHQGNISKAARAAKKERRAFQRLLHKHGLDRRVFSAA